MKYTLIIFLFAIELYGCSPKEKKVFTENPDVEMAVINDVLQYLIPKEPPCVPAPVEGENNEDYEKRLKELLDNFEASTKKIEIISILTELDSTYLERCRPSEKESILKLLFNAPKKERRIDSAMIVNIEGVRIILAEELWGIGGPISPDCNNLGQFNFSRVGFNKDSTKAAFSYYINNGSCTIMDGGTVESELKNGKWQIKK